MPYNFTKEQMVALENPGYEESQLSNPRYFTQSKGVSLCVAIYAGPMDPGDPGPVWHCSARSLQPGTVSREELRRRVLVAMKGVGNPIAKDWEYWSGLTYHIRREVSPDEKKIIKMVRSVQRSPSL